MTTFQAIIYAITQGLSQLLPLSATAHRSLVPYLLGWQPPHEVMMTAFTFGSLTALLLYFRHDLASMISSLLQVILFRKRPMTLDERLPVFIALSSLPLALASYYFHDPLGMAEWTPLGISAIFAASGIPLWFFDYIGRKNKGMFDWKWVDAIVVGVAQALAIIPGWDPMSGILVGALFLNYRREASVKYAYFSLTPILFARAIGGFQELNFKVPSAAPDVSWLSFGTATVVSCLVGLLMIGALMKHVQNKGFGQYVVYRMMMGSAVLLLYWYRG